MEGRSVAKLSTKKALSSLKFLMCCKGNAEDKLHPEMKSGFLNSPTKDKQLDDFDITAFINRFLTEQICRHGNSGSVCVSCYFEDQPNIEDYIIRRPDHVTPPESTYENIHAISPDSCVKEPIFVYDNQSFCECCETNNNQISNGQHCQNACNDKELQVAFDSDNVSICSSCYHSNCTMCREEENNAYVTNGDRTEFTLECSSPTFDAERLQRLLRQLNPNLPVTCVHGNYGDVLCCQGDELVSATDTASTGQSLGDKDSGVGRTDESVKNDESSEQDLAECAQSHKHATNPAHECNSNDSFTSNSTTAADGAISEDLLIRECDLFRQALEQRCDVTPKNEVSKLVSKENGQLERADSQSSIERELAALNKEMEKIQMECQQIVDAHKKETAKSVTFDTSQPQDSRSSPSRVVPRMGTRLDYAKQLQLQQEFPDPIWIPRETVLSGPKPQNGATSDKPNIILPLRGKSSSNAPKQNGTVDKKDERRKSPQHSQRESSCTSAYGTGESCRNTPLSLELGHIGGPSLSLMQNGDNHSENKDQFADLKCSVSKSVSNSSVNQITQTPEPGSDTLQELYSQYADVMYTNQANLQHTIMLQQKLFQQKLSQQQQSKSPKSPSQREETTHSYHNNNGTVPHSNGTVPHNKGTAPYNNGIASHIPQSQPIQNPQVASSRCEAAPLSPYSSLRQMRQNQSASPNTGNVQMEWVVKRRADGSRYITRRPMRSKMLKERAKKISEERSGMTTDDDAMSELKVGRYWSKDDRKRHLEKAREYKRRKQEMLRARMETVRENEEQKREQFNILELSQRKMMKHKSRKMYDDFTTVQEILAHGARNPHAPSESSSQSGVTPLLSVTTV